MVYEVAQELETAIMEVLPQAFTRIQRLPDSRYKYGVYVAVGTNVMLFRTPNEWAVVLAYRDSRIEANRKLAVV